MCMAAARVPKRELTTPVARKSWNVSEGTRARSSRNGIAEFMLPNRLTIPASADLCPSCPRHHRVRIPGGKEHETEGEQLGHVGEVVERGDDYVRRRPLLRLVEPVLLQQFLRAVDQDRQHDKQFTGHEGGNQRVPRGLQDAACRDRGQAGNQPGQDPEGEEQRHCSVPDQKDPQAAHLLGVHRAHCVRGDGEQADWRQTDRKLVRPTEYFLHNRKPGKQRLFLPLMPIRAIPRNPLKRTTAGTTLLASDWKAFVGM